MEVHNEMQTDEYDYYYPKDYTKGYPDESETEYICNLNLNHDMEIVIQTYVQT